MHPKIFSKRFVPIFSIQLHFAWIVLLVVIVGSLGRPQETAALPLKRDEPQETLVGIDVLAQRGFDILQGKRVGLITNQTGINREGRSTIDILFNAPGVKLVSLYSPEHGIRGTEEREGIPDTIDIRTGLPVYSLYGKVRRPTEEMLQNVDVLIYDIQDVGARYYTYTTTMAYAMEEAARRRIPFVILDRPNPIRGDIVEGDMLVDSLRSFVGYFSIPARYGLTIGELARYYNDVGHIGADLIIIPMKGWKRSMWFDETKLPWVNPSPNIRTLTQAILYSSLCPLEATNLSVGRGTDMPFEVYGAPYLNGKALADSMNASYFAGAHFYPIEFTPAASTFKGEKCYGVRIEVTNRNIIRPAEILVKLAQAIHKQSSTWEYHSPGFERLLGSPTLIHALDQNECPCTTIAKFQERDEEFMKTREKYLLYK